MRFSQFYLLFLLSTICTQLIAQIPTQVAQSSGNVTKIIYPEGARLAASHTEYGAVQVVLPLPTTLSGYMVRMRVEIHENRTNESLTAWISGYVSASDWLNPTAQLITNVADRDLPVHFDFITTGSGETKPAIWIGEESTLWQGARIQVAEVIVSLSNSAINQWTTGWEIDINDDFVGNANLLTIPFSTTLPLAQSATTAEVTPLLAEEMSDLTRLAFPQGATYSRNNGTAINGAIRIQLPQAYTSTMVWMRIEIHDPVSRKQSSVWVSGFTSNNWNHISAGVLASETGVELPVHFGQTTDQDGIPKATVWIGSETTEWKALKAQVAEVMVSYQNFDLSLWKSGWDVSLDSDPNFMNNVTQTINGDAALPVGQTPTMVAVEQDDLTRILFPEDAVYHSGATENGAIQVVLPDASANSMLRMRIEAYDLENNQGFTAWIEGYVIGHNWNKASGRILTNSFDYALPIKFGATTADDGLEKATVWIGEENTLWKHAKIQVAELQVGYNNNTIENWASGWDISISNSFPEIQKEYTADASLPLSQEAVYTSVVADREDLTRLTFPDGASFSASGGRTGGIEIALPFGYTSVMMRMRVEIYTNTGEESFSAWIGGYSRTGWDRVSGQILTTSENRSLPIRFGHNGLTGAEQRAVVWIGNEDTTWEFLKVNVAEVLLGHGNYSDIESWRQGWEVSVSPDFLNRVDRTITNTLPLSQTIWNTNATEEVIYASTQQVAIGLEDPGDFSLAIDGDVKARRVKVTAENWPDYVFEEDYALRSLDDLRSYIQQYGHLPNVPSKQVAEQDGVYVNDMNVLLLQKIEELTLYILEQEKRIQQLENRSRQQILKSQKTSKIK